MIRKINDLNKTIQYELLYKNVKNINLRIKPDKTIHVSAHKSVPLNIIDSFVLSKTNFILNAWNKYDTKSENTPKQYFNENEICSVITALCEKVYPYFKKRGVKYPKIKFRRMTSRWGSCNITKNILTFNTALMFAPLECIEYVVLHEFTHFLQVNHSYKFYEELEKICPDWKMLRLQLKNISV